MAIPGWQYDETKFSGVDYTDPGAVDAYDAKMQKLRDFGKESAEIIGLINLSKEHTLLDMGAGTGGFAIPAAKKCAKVYAVDISPFMLDCARRKAACESLENIEFHQAGFLTYEHRGKPLDAVVSQFVLHHLPDFWKFAALKRIGDMLKEGGKLYLKDAVYSFEPGAYMPVLDNLVKHISAEDADFARDIEKSIRDEYSTFAWVLEKLIGDAGFIIEEKKYDRGVFAQYLCTKM